jgi:ribosomal-protein-alanine N-acetyltransferase
MAAVLESTPLFRAMRFPDIARVMEVEKDCYSIPWTSQNFKDCLNSGYHCRIFEQGSDFIGHGVLAIGAGQAQILNLCIRPVFRRSGRGRAMLQHLVGLAESADAESVFLEVRVSNKGAQQLYNLEGFNEVGSRDGYYPAKNGREDALVFARSLL